MQLHFHKRVWEEQNKQDEVLPASADDGEWPHTGDDGFHPTGFPSRSYQPTQGHTREIPDINEKKLWGLER